jgi:tetratricopeptide (TPR) repeat protein
MTEEHEHLQKLIELHRANLQHYEELEAKYGLDCPVYVKNAKEEARKGLTEVKAKLAALEGGAPGAEPSILAIPQNLPPRGEFIGRDKEMEQVRQALASRSYLVVIEGIGGIGKTVLALEVAHELWEKGLYDGVIWTTARDRALDLNDILDTFARTIDYPYIAQLPPEEKAPEAAKLMRAKKCLLLVDNYETIKDEAVSGFLLNLPEPSKALITTRHHALGEARAIPLKGMEQGEALALMRAEGQRLGLESVQRAGDEILLRLYQATGGAPLAIKWAVGQIKQKGQSLDSVLDSLYGARGDLFEFMFNRSWEMLSEDAHRILMVMPIFATSASKEAIEAASDAHTWDLDEGLGQLVEMSLVEVSGGLEEQQRYSVHPLVRAFGEAESGKQVEFDKASHLRTADYFLNLAERHQWGKWGWQSHDEIERERENVFTIMDWCYEKYEWRRLCALWRSITFFLSFRGYWQDALRYGKMAVEASKHTGDKKELARILHWGLGWILCKQGHFQDAKEPLEQSLEIRREIGDTDGMCSALRNLAEAYRREKEFDRAEQVLSRALEMAKKIENEDKHSSMVAFLHYEWGKLSSDKGDWNDARRRLESVRTRYKGEIAYASLLRYLGFIAFKQGKIHEARSLYQESLTRSQQMQIQNKIALAKLGLANVEESEGNLSVALDLAKSANDILSRLGAERQAQDARELAERLERAVAEQESATGREN